MRIVVATFALLISSFGLCLSGSAEEIILSGLPAIKISEGGTDRVVEDLKEGKALEAVCTIMKIGDKYFWASRNNVELTPIQSGAFLTLVAVSGAGYVRITLPGLKDSVAAMMEDTEKRFDYVEHMLIGLRSVTYYGSAK